MFIDSNIFCYYFTKSSRFHEPVAEFLDQVIIEGKISISVVVLMEVAHYLVNNLGPIQGKKKTTQLIKFPINIYDFPYDLFPSSLNILAEHSPHGIGGRDAIILATMHQHNLTKIITHDQAFKLIEGIKVIDPIKND